MEPTQHVGLPASIAGYFSRDRDVATMLAPFSENAVVRDEGQEHRGRAAIRTWIEQTNAKYAPIVDVVESKAEGDRVIVDASVSGTFPGSPVRLRYTFTLEGARVVKLVVG